MPSKDLLRKIPKVDEILKNDEWKKLISVYPESLAKEVLRECLDSLRKLIRAGEANAIPPIGEIILSTKERLIVWMNPRLKRELMNRCNYTY
jgi:hypothetical protein